MSIILSTYLYDLHCAKNSPKSYGAEKNIERGLYTSSALNLHTSVQSLCFKDASRDEDEAQT